MYINEAKPTPTPWKIAEHTANGYDHIHIAYESETRSQMIADLHSKNIIHDGITEQHLNKLENAKLIVKAVNSFDKLKASLSHLINIIESDLGCWNIRNEMDDETIKQLQNDLKEYKQLFKELS